jgi:hypothetical protein
MTQRVTGQRFRQRKLSTKQNLPIVREHEVEQLTDDDASRHIPKVETGVEKGEEIVSCAMPLSAFTLVDAILPWRHHMDARCSLSRYVTFVTFLHLHLQNANTLGRSTICKPSYLPPRLHNKARLAERLRNSSSQPQMPLPVNCSMTTCIQSNSDSPRRTFASRLLSKTPQDVRIV